MGRGRVAPPVKDGDWVSVRQAINRLSALILGSEATPTFTGLTLSGLTANRLVATGIGGLLTASGIVIDASDNLSGIGTIGCGAITSSGVLTIKSDLVIDTGSITSVSGAISFGNENLSTTGTLGSGKLTITSATNPQFTINNADGSPDEFTIGMVASGVTSITSPSRLDLFSVSGQQIRLNAPNSFVNIVDDTVNPTSLLFQTDNLSNIGFNQIQNRPKNIWAGTNITAGVNITAGGRFLGGHGTPANPTYGFSGGSSEDGMGMYYITDSILGFAVDDVLEVSMSSTTVLLADDIDLILGGTGRVAIRT
ncbi:hypothetical protein LCGC14_1338880, partial [marine sediment metagenome]